MMKRWDYIPTRWGRLRQADCLEADRTHPVILDPVHQITKLMSGVSILACWRASIQMPSCFPLVVHCQAWHKISIQVDLCVHLDQDNPVINGPQISDHCSLKNQSQWAFKYQATTTLRLQLLTTVFTFISPTTIEAYIDSHV